MRCTEIPHGPDEPCTCTGCWFCEGGEVGCECDIDWEHVYGRHTVACGHRDALGSDRCDSCEHHVQMHDVDGRCWFVVDQGVPEMNAVCACLVRAGGEE